MAHRSLTAFRGHCVIHVGEWDGLTGSRNYEHALTASFSLTASLRLPQWGTDATILTIWHRAYPTDHRTTPESLLLCRLCGAAAVWRCRLARTLCYCGEPCVQDDAQGRCSALALQMIVEAPKPREATPATTSTSQRDATIALDLQNPDHFNRLSLVGGVRKTSFASGGQGRRARGSQDHE